MTTTGVTITTPSGYRNERPYPFCPGCGHGPILDALNEALMLRGRDPAQTVIVSDIGCSGLSDQYFTTSAFHGLHGRSITYASGIKLANPQLDVVVVMGDGGTGIGGTHLINAARRNIGITVLVFNNLNFGMTGGQHSTTTPVGAITPTTGYGNLEQPLDICSTVAVNGAGYVFRGTSFDNDLPERIAEAMGSGGFALLDVWELCTAYFVRNNKYSRRAIDATLGELNFATGVIQQMDRPEYAAAYRAQHAAHAGSPAPEPVPIATRFRAHLNRRHAIVFAGAAGGRVRSAARLAGRAAIASGLWAAQADDYPVTVKTGHSVSTLILSPDPIDHVGVTTPDTIVLLAPEGLAKAQPMLRRMTPAESVFAVGGLGSIDTAARLETIEFAERIGKTDLALAAAAAVVAELDLFPVEALQAAAALERKPEHALKVITAGIGSASI